MRVAFQDCQYSGFPGDGVYIGSGVKAVVSGSLIASDNGGNGISVGQSSHLISNSTHGHTVYNLSFKHIVPESLTLMNGLLSQSSLEKLSEDLVPMLAEIKEEVAKPQPDKLYTESIYLAINNFLARNTQRAVNSTDFTVLCRIAQRVYLAVHHGNDFSRDRKKFLDKREEIIYRKRLGFLDYFSKDMLRNGSWY